MTPEQVIGLYQESVDINDCARRVAEASQRELASARESVVERAIEVAQGHQDSYDHPVSIAICRSIVDDLRRLSATDGSGTNG